LAKDLAATLGQRRFFGIMKSAHMKIADREWQKEPPSVSSGYRPWLLDHGSLTARIVARCPAFSVREVHQRPAKPYRDEMPVLRLKPGKLALVREVFLFCGERPVVFAHSVVERHHLRGPWRSIDKMGSKPLGAALFANPRVERQPLRFRKLSRHDSLYRAACRIAECVSPHLWARRSVFTLKGASILVTEVFLPGILEL
jgi:chorismate lyase